MMLFILIACTCIYSVSTETVRFIQQPKTDKECYEEGDNGTLTLSFHVTGTTRLDSYIVALTINPHGTGGIKSNGTELIFYDTADRDVKHARFRVTMSYFSRTVEYQMDVTSIEHHDETDLLYAVISKTHSGEVMKVSSEGAQFLVPKTCPQSPQATTSSMSTMTNNGEGDSNQDHISDPNSPSMVTTAPNDDSRDDSTSKGNIPESILQAAQRHAIEIAVPIGIVFLICLAILIWLGFRPNPSGYSISTI